MCLQKIPLNEKSLFIKVTHDNMDLSICKALENSNNEIVYIISKNEPLGRLKDILIKYNELRRLR